MEAEKKGTAALELLLEEEFDQLYERLKSEEEKTVGVVWGGFFRRAAAFVVDLLILVVFSYALFYLAHVGYSVGLAAHDQSLSADNLELFLLFLSAGWIGLVTGYFVLLHGMEGRTVGKWLFGLRVVGARQERVTYNQALVRWIGSLISAIFFGLGFLWVLLSREKRGWHDFLARTWVIRERSPVPSKD